MTHLSALQHSALQPDRVEAEEAQTGPLTCASSKEATLAWAELPQVLLDLLAVVAEQQRQIIVLSRRVEAAELASIHVKVSEQASDHLHRALTGSVRALKDLGVPVGEVSVGNVRHAATLSVSRSKIKKQEREGKCSKEHRGRQPI